MGLFGKGKKKEAAPGSVGSGLDMPPPPPRQAGSSGALPSFSEQKEQDLDLPEIPELDMHQPGAPSMPKISDTGDAIPQMPHPDKAKLPAFGDTVAPKRAPTPPKPTRNPFLQPEHQAKPEPIFKEHPKPVEMHPKEEHHDHDEAYKHTPTDLPKSHQAYREGDAVYLKGDIFKELLDSIDAALEHHKTYLAKQEKVKNDAKEDVDYEKFMNTVEDIQRHLVITEAALFE